MGKAIAKQRNGKIDLLRFLFSLTVIFYHLNVDLSARKLRIGDFTFFSEGRIAVEFFFLVTGYLTAAKIYKMRNSANKVPSLGESTWDFMRKKIATILPYHFIAIALIIILYCSMNQQNVFRYMIKSLPSIFLLQMSGLPGSNVIGNEWYLSSMLIALLILYPICLRFYDAFTRIVAPIVGVFAVGTVIHNTGALGYNTEYIGMFYAGNIRAIGVISLGMFSFELFRAIRSAETVRQKRVLFTILEVFGYGFTLFYMTSTMMGKKQGGIIALILCITVGISFSELSYGQRFFHHRLFSFLGKCSLPIYLSQNIFREIGKKYLFEYSSIYYILFVLFGSIIFGIVLTCFVDGMKKLFFRLRQKSSAVS